MEDNLEKTVKEAGKQTTTFLEKILDPNLWISIGLVAVKILLILIVASIIIKVGKSAIGNIFKRRTKAPLQISERREATLVKLLQNILTYTVYFIAIVMILSSVKIDVTGLLAGAGILGLAVGFGAQNLVKDIIGGFFIIFEDQFSVGDYVTIGQFEGTVEEIGLRTTKIRSWTGEMNIVQNGNITEVTNYSLNNSIAVVDVMLGYDADLVTTEKVIEDLLVDFMQAHEGIVVGEPSILGIQQLDTTQVTLRVIAETLPLENWAIARELRKAIKIALDVHHIDVPNQRILMMTDGDNRTGRQVENG